MSILDLFRLDGNTLITGCRRGIGVYVAIPPSGEPPSN